MKAGVLRLDAHTPIWVVTDPGPKSELGDICFKTTLSLLGLQQRGGLDVEERHATIHGLEANAREDADARLAARRAYDNALGRARP